MPVLSLEPISLCGHLIARTCLGERTPLLSGPIKISEWRKFLMALKPIDTEEWSQSSRFWKCFLICKVSKFLADFFFSFTGLSVVKGDIIP